MGKAYNDLEKQRLQAEIMEREGLDDWYGPIQLNDMQTRLNKLPPPEEEEEPE